MANLSAVAFGAICTEPLRSMSSDKLREIAVYIDETDTLIIEWLRRCGVSDDRMAGAGLTGSQMQDDLRTWADAMEAGEPK